MENKKHFISFAALDPYLESNIISPEERKSSGDFIEWGDKNQYPFYIQDLYENVTTLHSIIEGNILFAAGDDITIQGLPVKNGTRFQDGVMDRKGTTINQLVASLLGDYYKFGGFAIQVIRDFNGEVVELSHLDLRFLRTNKENDVFFYSEKWQEGGRRKVKRYPTFLRNLDWAKLGDEERRRNASSVLFVKGNSCRAYPSPLFAAAVKDCEIERGIDDYHLNAIENGFTPSVMVNFNNGEPEDEIKEEIESDFNEKFSGHENAGRIVFSWNKSAETATTIEEIKVEDFGDRYSALAKHSRQQIFSSFRASPILFGLVTEANTGFSTDEFEQSFKLYNRTQIRPVQRLIADCFDKIYGAKGVLTITPFSLEETAEAKVN